MVSEFVGERLSKSGRRRGYLNLDEPLVDDVAGIASSDLRDQDDRHVVEAAPSRIEMIEKPAPGEIEFGLDIGRHILDNLQTRFSSRRSGRVGRDIGKRQDRREADEGSGHWIKLRRGPKCRPSIRTFSGSAMTRTRRSGPRRQCRWPPSPRTVRARNRCCSRIRCPNPMP